jgi:type IX secretion system PorP/SprF family membrane protein
MEKKYSLHVFILIIINFISIHSLIGQEGQLSQFFNAPLYFNPAEAGATKNIRVIANYRKQWQKINTGIITQALAADMPIGKFGVGLQIHSNSAGQSSLQRTNLMLTLARQIQIESNTFLGLGIQSGLVQYSIQDNHQFDNQYSSQVGYDPSLDNGENLSGGNQKKFDGGFGLTLENKKYSWRPKVSLAFNHLISSKQILSSVGSIKSYTLMNSSLEVYKSISPKVDIIPYIMLSKQNKAQNLQFGSRLGYQVSDKHKFFIGMAIRNQDALISYFGYDYKTSLIGLSYDANRSDLVPGSNGVGAWEISLRINFNKKDKKKGNKLESDDSTQIARTNADSIKTEPIIADLDSSQNIVKSKNNPLEKKDSITFPIKPIVQTLAKDTIKKPVQENKETVDYHSINPAQIKKHLFVYFDHDKSTLINSYKEKLDTFTASIDSLHNYTILVSGHTDSDGDSMYNIYLGQSRAQEVLKYLVEKGVHLKDIKTFTYGKTNPVTDNNDDAHKALNRRVEIILITE